MKSHACIWTDAITTAVNKADEESLAAIVAALMDAEAAKTAMRSLGYGHYGQSLILMVREVPKYVGGN